jgi:hypothetical protein
MFSGLGLREERTIVEEPRPVSFLQITQFQLDNLLNLAEALMQPGFAVFLFAREVQYVDHSWTS